MIASPVDASYAQSPNWLQHDSEAKRTHRHAKLNLFGSAARTRALRARAVTFSLSDYVQTAMLQPVERSGPTVNAKLNLSILYDMRVSRVTVYSSHYMPTQATNDLINKKYQARRNARTMVFLQYDSRERSTHCTTRFIRAHALAFFPIAERPMQTTMHVLLYGLFGYTFGISYTRRRGNGSSFSVPRGSSRFLCASLSSSVGARSHGLETHA